MGHINNKRFSVKLHYENNYYRLHVTHPDFRGRIRKRIGEKELDEAENTRLTILYEIGKHFSNTEFNKSDVESFLDNYIGMNVKCTVSIFDFKQDFLESKKGKINNKTKNMLTKSTISGYCTALKYFENYLKKNRIAPHPTQITESVLNDFYSFIKGAHNYKVKLHTKIKGFIRFLETVKRLPIDTGYKLSTFAEEYDNQCPEEDDIALTENQVKKLIELRRKFQKGGIDLERSIKSSKIPIEILDRQFKMKKENLIKCLDCFLFMISTGMYYADIMKSKLYFNGNSDIKYINYRRAKNGSLCKAIPIKDDGIFIAEEIIKQYQIKNSSNFPLNLSLTHFDKHLARISGFDAVGFKITNKMARKTFASRLYFIKNLPIHYLQLLLGHKDVKDTAHYLRILDDDIATEIMKWMSTDSNHLVDPNHFVNG